MAESKQNFDFIVEAKNLTKIFRDFWGRPKARAVDGLNLRIPPGRIFGLLGPNGSGKSTTVKLILGLLYPTRGTIRLLGEPPSNVAIKRYIGYQPEETYLYPYLTASETLNFFGSLLGLESGERNKRVSQLLSMVGLERAGNRRVGEFSKGMARRLTLAQALINDPDLVVLDEPTSGLDPIACREIKDVIRVLADRGKTVILCSHLLADVEDVCDTVTILYGGRVCAEGTVDEVLKIQDQARITVPDVDEKTVNEISRYLQDKYNSREISIDHPRISLERFFLDVVKQAQRKTMETSGAQSGSGVAEFLETGSSEQKPETARILSQLTGGEKQEESTEMSHEEGVEAEPSEAAEYKTAQSKLENLDGQTTSWETQSKQPETREKAAEISKEAEKDNETASQQSSEKLRNLLNSRSEK